MNCYQAIKERVDHYKSLRSLPKVLFGEKITSFEFSSSSIFIFGYGDFGREFETALKHSGINISGYIDNNQNIYKKPHQSIVYSPKDINGHDDKNIVIICVSVNFGIVEKQLLSLGWDSKRIFLGVEDRNKYGKNIFYYMSNCAVGVLAWQDTKVMNQRIRQDLKIIENVYDSLADDKSRNILTSRIALSLDGERYEPLINYLNEFSDSIYENRTKFGDSSKSPIALPEFDYYFKQDFLNFDYNETYVDVGAEDGNTIIPFINLMHGLKNLNYKIFAFEPDPDVFQLLERHIGGVSNVNLISKGVAEFSGVTGFSKSYKNIQTRKCGTIRKNGEINIDLTTIDEYFSNIKYSLIKIDPGGNIILGILRGAKDTINKYNPKIIAGAYHAIENLYMIPNEILKINPEYKVYLRHLAFHANETHAYGVL